MNKLFIAFILLAAFSANALVTPQTPKKDSDGCYLITNAAELYGFADMVNSRDSSEKTCARLDADITINKNLLDPEKVAAAARDTVDTIPPAPSCLESEDPCELEKWVPIGKSKNVYYTGRFDGRGHTISGLYIDMPERDSVGFFGVAAYGATIENLNIVDSYIRGRGDVGGVAGYLEGTVASKGGLFGRRKSAAYPSTVANNYVRRHRRSEPLRFDIIAIVKNEKETRINHIKNAFNVFNY